jgi:hypothetical protein
LTSLEELQGSTGAGEGDFKVQRQIGPGQ